MKVAGIITEYNPFHNGHKYQIDQIRSQTNADYIIIAMSGNFVQRGTPALADKYSRAQMALENGADLILELPAIWATASAEYFAKGGVSILQSTGVLDYLCFGAESSNLPLLQKNASVLNNETDESREKLTMLIKSGLPYPEARCKALNLAFEDNLYTPNNILAIEYLRALEGTNISPILIQRIGDGYNDREVISKFASATAIRQLLSDSAIDKATALTPAAKLLLEYNNKYGFIYSDAISDMLHYKLLLERNQGYEAYADCNSTLSNRIVNLLPEYKSFMQFCDLLKTKDITHSRIRRVLLHILLGIKAEHYSQAQKLDTAPYLRVLGFRRDASPLLNHIKKEASAPLITKVADASNSLTNDTKPIFDMDLLASDIYGALVNQNHKSSIKNDFQHELVIL